MSPYAPRLRTYTQPAKPFSAGATRPLCGLASWPLLGALLHISWRARGLRTPFEAVLRGGLQEEPAGSLAQKAFWGSRCAQNGWGGYSGLTSGLALYYSKNNQGPASLMHMITRCNFRFDSLQCEGIGPQVT